MDSSAGAVFLSYASEDAPAAARIAESLKGAGIEVWFDKSELRGGDAWDQMIRGQIRECRLFIPIISSHTEARGEGYFRLEWKLAVDRSHLKADDEAFLLPVVIDATSERGARVPDRFRQVQWVRLPGGEAPVSFVNRIAGLLRPVPGDPATPTPGSASSPAAAAPRPGVRGVRAVAAGLGVLLVAAAGLLYWRHTPTANPAPTAERSIAVLPFTDLSEKHDQEYFADGMAEEILDQLARVPELKVVSRTSSFQFKGRNVDVRSIGQALGARYVVEGAVRRAGDQIRVTAKLVDASDGSERWAERYDRSFGDVLGLQEQIAVSLARALQVSVGAADESRRLTVRVPAAYDAYLRARHAWDRFDRQGFDDAVALYREALRLDPQFARAAAALASAQVQMVNWGYLPDSGFADARQSAELAVRLDPSFAEPHAVLATTAVMHDWDWPAAEREIAAARALEPRNLFTERVSAQLAEARGDWAQASQHVDAALEIDPFSAVDHYFRSEIQLAVGHLEDAEAAARRVLQISPSYNWARYLLAKVLVARGRAGEALEVIAQEPDPEGRLYGTAIAQLALGQRAASDAALRQLTEVGSNDWAFGIAAVHGARGEADEAFRWLERAYTQHDADLYLIKANRELDPIRKDPRFGAFLRKLQLPD